MAAQVEIILKTIDQTGPGMKKAAGSFTELNSAIALARQGIEAMKKAYQFGKEGAQIDFLQSKFGRLAASIGTTSDVLMRDLRSATRGLYSDMELMASAGDLVALGLAKTKDEAVRLASVSAGLNMNMNQLVLTLTNMTTMRFDALGVSVDGFKEKVKELEAAGYSADAAFKEAFLQQAEAQLEKVGHAADTTLGTFMRFEAASKTAFDRFKANAAEAMEPTIALLADLLEANNDFSESMEQQNKIAEENAQFKERLAEIEEMSGKKKVAALAVLRREIDLYREAQAEAQVYADAYAQMAENAREAANVQIDFNAEMDKLNEILGGELGEAQDDYNAKIAEYAKQLENARTQKEKDEINANIAAETEEYNKRANAIIFNIQQEAILNSTMPDSAKIEMITALGQAYNIYDEATAHAMTTQQALIEQYTSGAITEETFLQRSRELAASFRESGKAATEAKKPIPDFVSNVGRAAERAEDAAAAFDSSFSPAAERLGDMIGSSALPMASALRLQLSGMPADGRAWNYYFNIHQSGSVPSLPTRGTNSGPGAGYDNNAGVDSPITTYTGGWLTNGVHIVGDLPGGGFGPQTEAIINGYVYNARQTRMLRDLGLLDGAMSHALDPGEGGGGGGTSGGRPGSGGSSGGGTSGGGTRPGRPGRPNRNPGGGGSAPASSFTPAVMAAEAAVEVAASSLMAAESIAANVQQGAQQTVSATYDSSGHVVDAVNNVAHKIDKLINTTREASYREAHLSV